MWIKIIVYIIYTIVIFIIRLIFKANVLQKSSLCSFETFSVPVLYRRYNLFSKINDRLVKTN